MHSVTEDEFTFLSPAWFSNTVPARTLRRFCQVPKGGMGHIRATLVGCIFSLFALQITSFLGDREMPH